MIGILARANERPVVREFFELFKTPWEFYQPRRRYVLVIATVEEIPQIDAPLVVVYGADATSIDGDGDATSSGPAPSSAFHCDGLSLPIYGRLRTFVGGTGGRVRAMTTAGDVAALEFDNARSRIMRVGYDLFEEIRHLLMTGQPREHGEEPTLDRHIALLRGWMANAGVEFVELPPVPAGYEFICCLTHDIDFVGIRRHFLDHTMWGFLYRSTIGALSKFFAQRMSIGRLFASWRAALSLPFVYLGWTADFWEPFRWYLDVEKGLAATYFLIPFKRRPGDRVSAAHASRRGAAYDVADIAHSVETLISNGCEVGVHGIDAWHDARKGAAELDRVAAIAGTRPLGVRMHWLLNDARTASTLEQAGYRYDATSGYNDTIGYRNGTTQIFRPLTTTTLVELPLHIQDGALFYPQNLNLSDDAATTRCQPLINQARASGGVLTILWHDRSHAAERFWGDFYIRLLATLRASKAWFATASQAVDWFRARRSVQFDRRADQRDSRPILRYEGAPIVPPLIVRRYDGKRFSDVQWDGVTSDWRLVTGEL